MPTVREQLEGKYGKPAVKPVSTPTKGSVRQALTAKYKPEAVEKTFGQKALGVTKAIGGALISSERGLGESISGALTNVIPESWTGILGTGVKSVKQAEQSRQDAITTSLKGLKQAKEQGKDETKWLKLLSDYTNTPVVSVEDIYPALKKTNLQVVGEGAGVLLDLLSFGSYGSAAKGMKTGKYFSKADKAVRAADKAKDLAQATSIAKNIETAGKFGTEIVTDIGKPALSSTLKQIGKKTAIRSTVGAGTGYAFDVSENLKSGKTGAGAFKPGMGTILGGAIPVVIGGAQATKAITKATAPRIINSLVKPKGANISYGKNPGRTISSYRSETLPKGIVGNNLEDFGNNIDKATDEVGSQIGDIYISPKNSKLAINASDELGKIDKAIAEAAKKGKNNQAVVTNLQNIKDALLYEHDIVDGVITKIGDTPRDLTKLTPKELFDLKKIVAEMTRFTGTPSDDKLVNSVLQDIYGGMKTKLNKAVRGNNPEIIRLNEQYGDLISGSLATRNRDKIVQSSNLINFKVGGAGALGTTAALLTGTTALPALLVGIGVGSLEKALETPAVKTRVAAWLGKASPTVIQEVLTANPSLGPIFYRLVPNLSSRLKVE